MTKRKVLVTGGAGYIGRHVVEQLVGQGDEVFIFDPGYDGKSLKATAADLSDMEADIFAAAGSPDVVVHLAWRDGFNHASDAHFHNLAWHYDFARKMMDSGVKQFVGMGTMHEIGYHEGAIDENTPTCPSSYYGIAKNALREATEIMAQKNDVVYQWVRAYYITGDDAKSQSIFRKIIEASERGEETFPFTSGKNKYDFIDVKDLAKQIVAVASQQEVTGVINCCSGKPMTLAERVEQFIADNKLAIRLEYGAYPDRAYDSPGVWGDSTKINQILAQ